MSFYAIILLFGFAGLFGTTIVIVIADVTRSEARAAARRRHPCVRGGRR